MIISIFTITNLFHASMDLPVLDISYKCVTFCVWLLSLNVMFSRFIHVAYINTHSFLLPHNFPLLLYIIFCLFMYQLIGILYCFHLLAIMNNAALNIYVYVLFGIWFHFSWVYT